MIYSRFAILLLLFTISLSSLDSLIDLLLISGNPSTLTINSAIAGSQPTAVSNNSTSYSISTLTTRIITGNLSANMPANVTLTVNLSPPPGATSLGPVTMTTTANTLITGANVIVLVAGLSITYTLSATVNAAQVTGDTRTLTLTMQ